MFFPRSSSFSNENIGSKKTSEIRVSVYLRERSAKKQVLTTKRERRQDRTCKIFRLFCKQKRDNAGDRSDQNNHSYHETLGVVLRLQIVA